MSEPLIIVVQREIKSVNDWMYKHWRAYMAERDAWLVMLRVHLRPRSTETRPMRAKIVSLRAREIDYGNLVGGCKPIPDCLKRLGYIHDDSPRWFVCEYQQHQAPKTLRCTRISLEPAA